MQVGLQKYANICQILRSADLLILFSVASATSLLFILASFKTQMTCIHNWGIFLTIKASIYRNVQIEDVYIMTYIYYIKNCLIKKY